MQNISKHVTTDGDIAGHILTTGINVPRIRPSRFGVLSQLYYLYCIIRKQTYCHEMRFWIENNCTKMHFWVGLCPGHR